MLELLRRAISDIGAAINVKNVWMTLAAEDIADSHRRTRLGPLWPLLNYLLFAGTIILIIGPMMPGVNFTAYIACGVLVWLFISETLTMSATLFIREAGFIQGTVLPISTYILRQTTKIAIRSAYALVGAVLLLAAGGVEFSPALLTVPPALLLLLATAPAVAVLFAFTGVFFRDFQHLVSNAMRLLMFITPVFWVKGAGGGVLGILYHWNPLTHYIEIVRQPVVGGSVPLASWGIAIALSLCLSAAALLMLGRFSREIVFRL